MRRENAKFLIVTILLGSFFAISNSLDDVKAACEPGECAAIGQFQSLDGDMCYTGNGCPSWVCEQNANLVWETSGGVPQCCVETSYDVPPQTVDKTCSYERCKTIQLEPEPYDCKTRWVCDESKQVCTGGGPIALGAEDVRTTTDSEGEVLYCWYECLRGHNEEYGCKYRPNSETYCWDVDYDCSYTVPGYTVYEDSCRPSTASQGDTCQYCPTGWTGNGGGGGGGGGACDPNDWGPWSACTASCGGGTQSRVNDCGTFDSRGCNTQACSSTVNIQGYIWNATDTSCTSSPDSSLEIVNGSDDYDISGSVAVTLDGSTSGTWDPDSFNGYSYQFTGVDTGNHVITANVPAPVGFPNASYRLACVNNQETGIATVNAQASPTTLHLGYRVTSTGWWQSITGDVLGGCNEDNCSNSISVSIPDAGDILGGFAESLVDDIGTVFGNSGVSVSNSNFSEDDNRHLEYYGSDEWFPTSFSFDPPTNATEITDCSGIFQGNNLDAGEVYYGDVSCIQDGLDGLSGNYNFTNDGVATIYVTGTDTLTFNDEFTASNSNRRVLFAAEGPVEISETIGTASPTPSTSPHIQASIISDQNITFLSDGLGTDSTIVVEGPLVSKDGVVNFNRDRGLQNDYPAEVVVYNPLYLVSLSSSTPSGVSSVDISWVLRN